MLMRNFLQSRRSVREFKARGLAAATIKEVQALIDRIQTKADPFHVKFTLVEKGDALYRSLEGKGGYAGTMIKAPSYIVMDVDRSDAQSWLNGAYYMEDLITQLIPLNLGSCWISLTHVSEEDRRALAQHGVQDAPYLLAIGQPNTSSLVGEEPYSSRLGVEDLVYKDKLNNPISLEELEQRGLDDLFYYVRFAPSQYNEQPWRYVVRDHTIDMYVRDAGNNNFLVEAGIAMYYFEKLLSTLSIPSRFESAGLPDEGEYKYIGSIDV